MQCPKCEADLETKTFGGRYEVQRCSDCQGLWVHRDVLPQMKAQWMSDAVFDSGDAAKGREMDAKGGDCPECGNALERIADEKQIHIHLDVCNECDGVWFDAGEFTDWNHEDFMDVVKDLLERWKR